MLSRTEPDGVSISYTYDLAGRETSQTTPAGTVSKAYNELGNLTTVTDPEGGVTSYVYDDRGRQVEIHFPNDVVDTYILDDLSRILRIESNGSSGLIRSMDYKLDATGRRIAIAEHTGRIVNYEYDTLYRLTAERIEDPILGARDIEYTYDSSGNRLTKIDSVAGLTTYTYDANDRLLAKNRAGIITTYTYDDNGNLLAEYTNDGNRRAYIWDAENRLLSATVVKEGKSTDASYKYDDEGLRVEASAQGKTTRSLLDKNTRNAQLVVEYAPNHAVEASYVRGAQLISVRRDTLTSVYHADAIGTIRFMTNESGAVVNQYVYDAYGNVLDESVEIPNTILYAGELRDSTLGWDFLRERYASIVTGRFVSRDPFGGFATEPLSLNRFTYVHNDPLNNTDPGGRNAVAVLILGAKVGVLFLLVSEVYQAAVGTETYIAYRVKQFFGLPTVRGKVARTKQWLKLGFKEATRSVKTIPSTISVSGWAYAIGLEVANNTNPDDEFFGEMLKKGRSLSDSGGGGDEYEVMVSLLEEYLETVRENPKKQKEAAYEFNAGMRRISGPVADSYEW